MKLVRYLMLAVSIGATGVVLAQDARETSGMQAAPLSIIDDARQQFQRGNLKESAKDLRSGVTLFRVEGERYPGAEGALIVGGAADLEKLASGIDDGSIKTVEQFNKAAAAAVLSKAKAHHATAVKAWSSRQRARTAQEILAASHALEHAWKWTDDSASKEAKDLIARAEVTAEKLTKDKSVTDTEVSGVIDAVGSKIEDLAKQATSPRASH